MYASAPQWETVTPMTSGKDDAQLTDQLEVSREGEYIYLTVSRRSTVRLYTILGQMVSQQTVEPGTYRFRLKARGIYILKCGNSTRRITY